MIRKLLREAYDLDQVQRKQPEAVVHLKKAIEADPDLASAAKTEMYRLRDIVSARTLGQRCMCHVEKVSLDLLIEATKGAL